jgi:hypothetical protein
MAEPAVVHPTVQQAVHMPVHATVQMVPSLANRMSRSFGASHVASEGASRAAPDHAPHVAPNGASDVASHWRPLFHIGDSVVVGIDGSLAPSARECALALIGHLQYHSVLRERWISSKALELEFYPEFLS